MNEPIDYTASEFPYEEEDLRGKKKPELVAMVKRQLGRWPYDGRDRFNESKTTVSTIKAVLLNPAHGFTKAVCAVTPDTSGEEEQAEMAPPADQSSGCGDASTRSETLDGAGRVMQPGTSDSAGQDHGNDESAVVVGDMGDSEQGPLFPQSHQVHIYIDDMRRAGSPLRTACAVVLTEIDRQGCGNDGWRVSTHELLRELQRTAAALSGPVRLSFPDAAYPEYNLCFVKTQPGEALEDAVPDLNVLVMPNSDVFQLIVEQVTGDGPFNGPFDNSVAVHNDPSAMAGPSTPVTVGAGSSTDTRMERARKQADVRQAQVAWLTERLKERPDYAAFRKGQHRIQCNADIVASWRFAVDFCGEYNKRVVPQIGTAGITKSTIQMALGVGSTWMSEAENAMSIIQVYGDGGTNPRQEVIDAVASRADKPEGAKSLIRFLKDQE